MASTRWTASTSARRFPASLWQGTTTLRSIGGVIVNEGGLVTDPPGAVQPRSTGFRGSSSILLDFHAAIGRPSRSCMAYRPEPHVLEAFAAETRRILARRVPLGICFFVGVVAVAGLIELASHPERLGGLVASFSAE